MVYCIYRGKIYSQGVIINNVIAHCITNYTNCTNFLLSKSLKISLASLSLSFSILVTVIIASEIYC